MFTEASSNAPPGERLLALEGARNLRDLGGYHAADGQWVRWGRVFRSGNPAGLTRADWDHLVTRGVRSLCDLRTTEERAAAPFGWADTPGFNYWAQDSSSSFGELRALIASEFPTAAAAREAMLAGYRRLPFQQAPAFQEIFRRLKADEVPLIFNCSAGKDRAGTAAALVLSVLGVSREQVIEDYLLSNLHIDVPRMLAGGKPGDSLLGRQSPEVATAILSCEPGYLNAAFAAIDETCGSFEAYLNGVLALDGQAVKSIRNNLLEA